MHEGASKGKHIQIFDYSKLNSKNKIVFLKLNNNRARKPESGFRAFTKKYSSKLIVALLVLVVAGFNFSYFKKSSSKQQETQGQVLGAFTTNSEAAQSTESLFAKTAQAANLQDNDTADRKPFEYEVEGGDTVSSIAEKYSLNINTILWANNLTAKSIIRPGQKLVLLPVDGVIYTVKKGDTIGKIAGMHESDTQKVMEYNDIADAAKIHAGEAIIIPDGKPLPPPAPKIAKNTLPQTGESKNNIPSTAVVPGSVAVTSLVWPTTTKNLSQGYSSSHRGLDIANGGKPPILAALSGTVEFAGESGDWGRTMLIRSDDGSITTRYSHASEIDVEAGQYVNAGDPIGVVGNTGHVHGKTGLHLDFRVYKNGVAINPKTLLN